MLWGTILADSAMTHTVKNTQNMISPIKSARLPVCLKGRRCTICAQQAALPHDLPRLFLARADSSTSQGNTQFLAVPAASAPSAHVQCIVIYLWNSLCCVSVTASPLH